MSNLRAEVLTAQLRAAIKGRAVRAAVFTTFAFEPEFFELWVLPTLFERAWSRDAGVRRAQVEEALRDTDHVAVYYDRQQFAGGLAGLDYARFGVSRNSGCFHAKNALILVEGNAAGLPQARSLLVLTTSANLTRAGWWENVEIGHIEELPAGRPHPLRGALLDERGAWGLLRQVRRHDRTGASHEAVDEIRDFLLRDVPAGTAPGPSFWCGRGSFADFLALHVGRGLRLEIISPYVEDTSSARTLGALIDATHPAEVRIHLPIGRDASAAIHEEYAHAVAALPRVAWADLPGSLTAWSKEAGGGHRFVHAKVYRFFDAHREVIVAGSVNLTAAAHSEASAGNFESAVLAREEGRAQREWWMARREALPDHFAPVVGNEDQPRPEPPPLHLRFDWPTRGLSYFWEAERPPRAFEIVTGDWRAPVSTPATDSWTPIPTEDAAGLAERIRTSASVAVEIDGQVFRLLVREEGMEDRPSLVRELTPEQILEYWALLSQEQRDAFLEKHGYRLPDLTEPGTSPTPRDATEGGMTFFDRFAGVFHAFSCLREHVEASLAAGRAKEAAFRLLGKKHDSLGALLDRVFEDPTGEITLRYVQFLCAQEVLTTIVARHPKWADDHALAVDELRGSLARVDLLRAQLRLPGDGTRFLDWFEEEFFRPLEGR